MTFRKELIALLEKYKDDYVNPHLLLGVINGLKDTSYEEEDIEWIWDMCDNMWSR